MAFYLCFDTINCQNPNLTTTQPQPNLNLGGWGEVVAFYLSWGGVTNQKYFDYKKYGHDNHLKINVMCFDTIEINILFNHSHSSHLNKVRDSQSSDLDDATIAHEDGKHF